MTRPVLVQNLEHLDWSAEWPDQVGYWWFTHTNGKWVFATFMTQEDLEEMKVEQALYLHLLHISRMTRSIPVMPSPCVW